MRASASLRQANDISGLNMQNPSVINVLNELDPVTVIGASGQMGGWFCKMLRSQGLTVNEIDVDTPTSVIDNVLGTSLCVIVSVPIARTAKVIEETLPKLSPDALLADLTSVKERPLAAMSKHPGEVLGLHPMCAPLVSDLRGQTVIACEGGSDSKPRPKSAALKAALTNLGAKIVNMSAERHDRMMAVVQGLNHFHAIVFAHALRETGFSAAETMEVASPVYALRMQLLGRILAQSPELYVDIELENPYIPSALEAYLKSVISFKKSIEDKQRDECLEFFNEAALAFGEYRNEALRISAKLIGKSSDHAVKD